MREPGIFQLGADVAEALLLVGDVANAEAAITELEGHRAHPWAAGAALRGRGMPHAAAGDLDRGIAAQLAALDALAVAEQPLEIGRTLLALGATQRRAKRRMAARRSLEAAASLFGDIDAPLWAARARNEMGRLWPPARGGPRRADRKRAAGRGAGGRRTAQPRHRRLAVRIRTDRRVQPDAGISQTRSPVAHPACPPPRRRAR